MRALGWGEGDEVLTSPLSFVASTNCLLYESATPVFCDIDPVTLTVDPEAVASAVGERTAGILPVHIFGYPADLPALAKTAEDRGVPMLEDACQALGAVDKMGRRVGLAASWAMRARWANSAAAKLQTSAGSGLDGLRRGGATYAPGRISCLAPNPRDLGAGSTIGRRKELVVGSLARSRTAGRCRTRALPVSARGF